MPDLQLMVTVPVCSFRRPYARMYLESERFPPPSTVYGFLLSLVGEEERERHAGSQLAIGIINPPEVSRILRTTWRVKSKKKPLGSDANRCPDYQEILTDLAVCIWVKSGELAERLTTFNDPTQIKRYGGLSLGESRDLVNDIHIHTEPLEVTATLLIEDPKGRYTLPVWVDHVGSKSTRWGHFSLYEGRTLAHPPEESWVTILPVD